MGPKFALRGRQSYTAVASNSVKKMHVHVHIFLNKWKMSYWILDLTKKNEFTYLPKTKAMWTILKKILNIIYNIIFFLDWRYKDMVFVECIFPAVS